MYLRLPRLAALAAVLATLVLLALPALAAQPLTQTQRKIYELKRAFNRLEATQRMANARAFEYRRKHGHFPKGFRLRRDREFGGGESFESEKDAALRASLSAPITTSLSPTAFPANVRVNNPGTDLVAGSGQSETSIAADGNNLLVTWNDGEGFGHYPGGPPAQYQLQGYGFSSDGGATFTDGGAVPAPVGFPKWEWISDPVVVVNTTTHEFWYCGLMYPDGPPTTDGGTGSHNGVGVVKGTFSGSTFTWGTPVVVVDSLSSQFIYDKEWIAVNPLNGDVYVSWTRFDISGDRIEFSRSRNGGATWSAPFVLSNATDNLNGLVQGSRVFVGLDSTVYAVWQAIGLTTDNDFFRMRKSLNSGTNWGSEVQAATYYSNFGTGAPGFNRERGITYPGIAVDRTTGPNRGRIYLAWNESVDYFPELAAGAGLVVEPEATNATGVNDTPATATLFTPGNTLRGTLANQNDLDYWKFSATAGTTYAFYMDSMDVGLDILFRVFCSDGTTRLAVSDLGPGFGHVIAWTAPATGTYYLRAVFDPTTSSSTSGGYHIITRPHTPSVNDRARDARDIFVAFSDDGLTWSASNIARVNDDAVGYDDWLPEVAVTGNSRVFCAYFDWRDSAPSACGGQSNVYLYRSDNGGAAWTNLGRVTDATSDWTNVSSNIAPNQGDYVSLFANFNGVYPAWADGREGNPNVYTVSIPIATPTLASLARSVVAPGRVELTWMASDYVGQSATLERRDATGLWTALGEAIVDGTGAVRFVDEAALAGQTYSYRLALGVPTAPTYSAIAEIRVPFGPSLALEGARPNPAQRELWVSFSLPGSAPATLSLVDIAGRVVRSREIGGLGAGSHVVNLGDGPALPAGVYVVVMRSGERVLTRRVSVLP
jgi:hypothetical protein